MPKMMSSLDIKDALIKNPEKLREMSRGLGIPYKKLSAIIKGETNLSEDEKLSLIKNNEIDYQILWGEGGILNPMTTEKNALSIIFHDGEIDLNPGDLVFVPDIQNQSFEDK